MANIVDFLATAGKNKVAAYRSGVIWTAPNLYPRGGKLKLFIEAVSADSLPADPNLFVAPDGVSIAAINPIPPGTTQTVPIVIRWNNDGRSSFYVAGVGYSLELTATAGPIYTPSPVSGASHMVDGS